MALRQQRPYGGLYEQLRPHLKAALLGDAAPGDYLPNRIEYFAALIIAVAMPSLVRADGGAWNRETFEYYASIIRKQPATHSRIIQACTENGLAAMTDRARTEVERDSEMPPEKATAEVCRRMVKGIASGAVTYKAYRSWADAPDDKRVVFPDYK
ncbi:hypothetical protein [Rhizobium sp. 1399]|uniref:hypothetical protein n=1 Tax=Rhizobium sp. 1399 TaxID=2817758 RepID=UPI002859D9A0|nr:hypothetical protein [Rhizobium sp. 1399]MDR6667972.1 putative SnoaL-like aldol condensation-catalyzing enzyme [Rhizobium sp. 1399]